MAHAKQTRKKCYHDGITFFREFFCLSFFLGFILRLLCFCFSCASSPMLHAWQTDDIGEREGFLMPTIETVPSTFFVSFSSSRIATPLELCSVKVVNVIVVWLPWSRLAPGDLFTSTFFLAFSLSFYVCIVEWGKS